MSPLCQCNVHLFSIIFIIIIITVSMLLSADVIYVVPSVETGPHNISCTLYLGNKSDSDIMRVILEDVSVL